MIEILSSGAPNVIQDLGRAGHQHLGVSRSGAMDAPALRCANALLGNAAGAAGIEIGLFPFRIRFHTDAAFAVTGAVCAARLDGVELPPWWATPARAGQTLVIDAPTCGARATLGVQGGIDVPEWMGSRATERKSGLGGLLGRGLLRGDRLGLLDPTDDMPRFTHGVGAVPDERTAYHAELRDGLVQVRALPAAEYDAFTVQARTLFHSSDWTITADANRMGYRLAGPRLALEQPLELLSHGLLPGTVQVPPSGQPIVQLAEANTCGGYPKIATVFETDLWRLAQAPVGTRVRFTPGTLDEALDALRRQAARHAALLQQLALFRSRR